MSKNLVGFDASLNNISVLKLISLQSTSFATIGSSKLAT